tara:strand:+ start:96 stop:1043 length:948 start_codon:yes stop_codon:yes gene_type:complete
MSGTVEVGGVAGEVTEADLKAFQDTGKPEGTPEPKVAEKPAQDAGREEDDAPEDETPEQKAERISASRARRDRQKAARERERLEKVADRARIAQLEKQLTELSQGTAQTRDAALAGRFDQIRAVFQDAERAIADGATGAALVEALARRDAAREEAGKVLAERNALAQSVQRTTAPAHAPQQQRAISPEMKRHAETFMATVPFLNDDPDSDDAATVKALDEELTREGWNPSLQGYWTELADRTKEALPHRFASAKRGGPNLSGSSRSGGAPAGAATNPLTQARIQAMKDAGMWDDPKEREKMITRYREYDKANSAR